MLRVLKIKKQLAEKRKALKACVTEMEELNKREQDIAKAIEEAASDEDMAVVEEAIAAFENDKKKAQEKEANFNKEVEDLEKELSDIESEQDADKAPHEEEKPKEERKGEITMNTRKAYGQRSAQEVRSIIERDDVRSWLDGMRTAIREKRAVSNVGLTIPTDVLPLLKENIVRYSKLLDKVNLVSVSGVGREVVAGTVSEAIWTECCANLNELDLGFNDWEVDCYKVGGYFAVCKANVEDSDYDLAAVILDALGLAIGKAIDKAILFGRNTSANSKMPLGILTRLAQTTEPAGYPTTARTWADLTSHIVSHAASVKGEALFAALIEDSALAASDYSRGELTWVMNDKTYKSLLAASLKYNANGAIVAGVNGTMPVVGGDIEVLNFMPDNIIIAGYYDLYLMGERAGAQFAESEHVRFLNDQVVYKGTARYDGAPIIPEAFVAIGINGATPSAAAVTFPQDTANTEATK